MHKPTTFVVVDARTMDGDPFDVANRACLQAAAVARILQQCIAGARLMARNSEMERKLLAGDDPDAAGFDQTTQGKTLAQLANSAAEIERKLKVLAQASSFDPRAKD